MCLATKVGFMFATPEYPLRGNIVAAFGIYGLRGGLLRWNGNGIMSYAESIFFVQILVSFLVWCMYALRSRSRIRTAGHGHGIDACVYATTARASTAGGTRRLGASRRRVMGIVERGSRRVS